jgi:hypothetical protein
MNFNRTAKVCGGPNTEGEFVRPLGHEPKEKSLPHIVFISAEIDVDDEERVRRREMSLNINTSRAEWSRGWVTKNVRGEGGERLKGKEKIGSMGGKRKSKQFMSSIGPITIGRHFITTAKP